MPASGHHILTLALNHVVRLSPRSVLDVGTGFGKWGYLIREALDFTSAGRYRREDWLVKIDGVDAFPTCSPLIDWVYDSHEIADVSSLPDDRLGGYDLVVMGDVIEHFEKQKGRMLLERLLRLDGCVIVATPSGFFEQGALLGNEYERHRSLWTVADFAGWPADIDVVEGTLLAAVRGTGHYPDDSRVRASRVVRHTPGLRGRTALATAAKTALLRVFG